MRAELICWDNPRSILEASEIAEENDKRQDAFEYQAVLFGAVFAWLVAGKRLSDIGERTIVAARKFRPELVAHVSFEEIANRKGQCKSAAHNLAMDFEAIFKMRSENDKSQTARAAYSRAWGVKK